MIDEVTFPTKPLKLQDCIACCIVSCRLERVFENYKWTFFRPSRAAILVVKLGSLNPMYIWLFSIVLHRLVLMRRLAFVSSCMSLNCENSLSCVEASRVFVIL